MWWDPQNCSCILSIWLRLILHHVHCSMFIDVCIYSMYNFYKVNFTPFSGYCIVEIYQVVSSVQNMTYFLIWGKYNFQKSDCSWILWMSFHIICHLYNFVGIHFLHTSPLGGTLIKVHHSVHSSRYFVCGHSSFSVIIGTNQI
jgi:hypothetical protein